MIKSKLSMKNSGLSAKEAKQKKKGDTRKLKPYPVPEEDSFIPPQDDSAEIKYMRCYLPGFLFSSLILMGSCLVSKTSVISIPSCISL
jgi:hypothetical protein